MAKVRANAVMRAGTRSLVATCLLLGCGPSDPSVGDGGYDDASDAARDDASDADSAYRALDVGALPADGTARALEATYEVDSRLVVEVDGITIGALLSIEVAADAPVDAQVDGLDATEREERAVWWRTRPAPSAAFMIVIDTSPGTEVRLRIVTRTAPPDALRDKSLAWTDEAIVDAPDVVGLRRVLEAAAGADAEPATHLDAWLRRFARTAHSERPALADFADRLRATYGDDPSSWSLDALPFRVTAVHNRIDLRSDAHCGELRVSFNVTDSAFPFIHFLFLFAQTPTELDVSVTGTLHCEDTAFRWAALSGTTDEDFVARAASILDRTLRPDTFLLAESLERSVGTWEWRQWTPVDDAWDNPPLFQTVDVARLNAPGPDREAFLSWASTEAERIAERRALVPSHFAPQSARAAEGILREPLDLTGLDTTLDVSVLGAALDRVGCPGCHARSPTFLQTNADRTFSPFYQDELEARGRALDSFRTGAPTPIPFGALSD